ncbi:hypothetical protein [Robbsia andropogonis]|uniref:hypothetical protein n=1 Tax=Robbsia andropogonis TaxID=28092 RepID=UPI00209E0C71|nr:hypothetical protein [Robbsia andropogonis]MCP1121010.1 hypothetical protein [Robbsia andropogonis]
MRRYRSFFLAILLILAAGTAEAARVSQVSTRLHARTVIVSQVVSGVASPSSTMKVNYGPTHSSVSSGFDISGETNSIVALSNSAPAMAVSTYGNLSLTSAQIISTSMAYIQQQLASYIPKLSAYASTLDVSRVYYTLDQEVLPTGATSSVRLVWSMMVDANGHATYAQPTIYNASPGFVYVSYTPLAVASGLPQNWQYTSAGVMTYQLFSTTGAALSAVASVDTKGAYDAPQASTTAVDNDAGLKCLIDNTIGGCSTSYPSAKGLIGSLSASFAIVDYLRMVQPVYNEVESPAGSGNYAQIPAVSIGVTLRSWFYQTCTSKSYRNIGYYGYTLLTQVDRYLVQGDGSYALQYSYQGSNASPYENYDYTRGLTDAEFTALSAYMIDPSNPSSTLLATSAVPNLVQLAALSEGASQAPTTYSVVSNGAYGSSYDVSPHDHIIEFSGSSSDDYYNSTTYSGASSFSIASVSQVSSARLVSITGASVVVSTDVNNNTVYSTGRNGGRIVKCAVTAGIEAGVWPGVSPSNVPLYTSQTYGEYCTEQSAFNGTVNVCQGDGGDGQTCSSYAGTWFPQYSWVALNNSGVSQTPNLYPNMDVKPYLGAGTNTVSFRAIPAGGGSNWDIKYEIIDACD